MSLREDLEEIMRDGVVAFLPAEQIVTMKTDTSERIINKVLDKAIEVARQQKQSMSMHISIGSCELQHETVEQVVSAIQKLRSEK